MKIEQLPSGTFRARVYIGKNAAGKPVYKSLTGQTKGGLRKKIAEVTLHKADMMIDNAVTVGDALQHFIDDRKPVLSPATVRGYLTIDRTLKKEYARFYTSECHSADLQALINDMLRSGRSAKTVRNYVAVIRSAIENAGQKPKEAVLPAREKVGYHIPTDNEIKQLLAFVKGSDLEVAVHLGLCGMRRSEICGIRGDDVTGTRLHVQRAIVKNPDGGWITKGTKTYSSDRYIIITASDADYIKKNGYAYKSVPTALSDNFHHAVLRAGLPAFRFHDLRHFFASYAHNVLRLSDKQIQALGGWRSNYTLQSVYEHSMNDEEAGEAVASALEMLDKIN